MKYENTFKIIFIFLFVIFLTMYISVGSNYYEYELHKKIGPGIFVCAPNNINVQGKITNESDELKGKENEDTDW